MPEGDTIAAIATAPGEAGVAVIRISGPEAAAVLGRCFSGKHDPTAAPRTLTYGRFLRGREEVDLGLAVYMPGPHSFTGEDVAELHCHGGQAATRRVLEAALEAGARMAERGEFSRRAFLNGRMDLTQAEAVMDMVAARTDRAAVQALHQLQGKLGHAIMAMQDKLLDMIAKIEVTCDYPDEDLPEAVVADWNEDLSRTADELQHLLDTGRSGRLLRDGLSCALVGRPNVGKSSLLNALLREERVIVTPIPGTTRDTVEASVELDGQCINLTDTAGIRESDDPVEALGIARSRDALNGADLAIAVLDAAEGITEEDREVLELVSAMPHLIVANKADLAEAPILPEETVLSVSARTGLGMDTLEQALLAACGSGQTAPGEAVLTRTRHLDAVRRAREAVLEAREVLETGYPPDMATGALRGAWKALGEVTGGTVDEDVIDRIFEKFCLGK